MCDELTVITDISSLCRTCLSQKTNEELKCLSDNNLSKHLMEITNVNVIITRYSFSF